MEDCIFCKIAAGQIPGEVIYEDEEILAFNDLNPQAPVHFLVIPKIHIESANDIDSSNSDLVGRVFEIISSLAKEQGLGEDGYRIVNNCGKLGGQTVSHIHFHVLGERQLLWPPG